MPGTFNFQAPADKRVKITQSDGFEFFLEPGDNASFVMENLGTMGFEYLDPLTPEEVQAAAEPLKEGW